MIAKKEKIFRSIGESALLLSVSALIVKIIGVVYKVPLTYLLGVEGMGYFNSAYTIYGFFYTVCSAGIPKAVTIYIKREESAGRTGIGREVYIYSMRFFALCGIFLTLLYIILAKPLSELIGNSSALYSIIAIGPSILFVILSGVARGYLTVKTKLVDIAVSQLIEAFSKLGFGLYFAYLGYRLSMSIPMVSAMSILGITLGSFLSLIYLTIRSKSRNIGLNSRQNIKPSGKNVVREVLKISLPITLSASLLSLSSIIDLGIIMRRLKEVGLDEAAASSEYGILTTLAVPMLMLVVSITTPLCVPLLPKLTECSCRGDEAKFKRELCDTLRKICLICIPASLCFLLFPFEILDVLFLSQDSVKGAELLTLLAPSAIFLPLLTAINTALESIGKIRITVLSLLSGAICKSVLGYALIGIPELGITGAAISTTVSYFLSLAYSYASLKRCVGRIGFFKDILFFSSVSLLAFVPFYLLYLQNIPNNHFVNLILCGFLGASTYLGLLVIFQVLERKMQKQSSNCTKQMQTI